MNHKPPQLVMLRPELQSLPPVQLPAGYSSRALRPGEEACWERIVNEAFQYKFRFADRLSSSPIYSPDRVLFVCDSDDIPVATATAWHQPHWGEETGYLHMVGVLTAHGGRGLGGQVSLAALHRMTDEGRTKVVLQTDDFRLPAIRTYWKLGFQPLIEHESHAQRWHDIARKLDDRSLSEWLALHEPRIAEQHAKEFLS